MRWRQSRARGQAKPHDKQPAWYSSDCTNSPIGLRCSQPRRSSKNVIDDDQEQHKGVFPGASQFDRVSQPEQINLLVPAMFSTSDRSVCQELRKYETSHRLVEHVDKTRFNWTIPDLVQCSSHALREQCCVRQLPHQEQLRVEEWVWIHSWVSRWQRPSPGTE